MFNYQLIIVVLVIAAAAVYVARTFWKSITSKPGGSCGSCSSCGDEATKVKTRSLVSLDDGPAKR